MPQTLLSLLALVGAAYFTMGQQQGSAHTLESIIRDEFEVAVAGALLHTVEFADSRAFDEATTPERLRARLGLPQRLTQTVLDTLSMADVMTATSSFTAPTAFGLAPTGTVARCDARVQTASVNCNDVSDFNDRTSSAWRDVTLTTPNGAALPVEVHIEVAYVESSNPDVAVTYRTNHKRVDVWARSPLLLRQYPQHAVWMRRVISFDPAVALEYLKRTTCVITDAYAGQIAAAQAQLVAAEAAAVAARARSATAAATAAATEATARQRAADLATANAAAATATAAQNSAWTTRSDALATRDYWQREYDRASRKRDRDRINADYLDPAKAAFTAADTAYNTARDRATAATNTATAALTASTNAWTAATAAAAAATQATSDGAAADAAVTAAAATLARLDGGCPA